MLSYLSNQEMVKQATKLKELLYTDSTVLIKVVDLLAEVCRRLPPKKSSETKEEKFFRTF
ncbi:MAG: hypothetical protein ABIK21_00635 [bacterium]